MKQNYIHVCFVIDESGSMCDTVSDVIGGFKKVIDEQRAVENGTCSVSCFKFRTDVEEVYIGKDVKDVEYLDGKYSPGGCTALFDGVGTAIDKIGSWLDSMEEDEKPEKNIIVIMTDGEENSSKEYKKERINEMIKHQEEKYSWEFVYMGSDMTNANDARSIGINTRFFSSKLNYLDNYTNISDSITAYRLDDREVTLKACSLKKSLSDSGERVTKEYAEANNLDVDILLD